MIQDSALNPFAIINGFQDLCKPISVAVLLSTTPCHLTSSLISPSVVLHTSVSPSCRFQEHFQKKKTTKKKAADRWRNRVKGQGFLEKYFVHLIINTNQNIFPKIHFNLATSAGAAIPCFLFCCFLLCNDLSVMSCPCLHACGWCVMARGYLT